MGLEKAMTKTPQKEATMREIWTLLRLSFVKILWRRAAQKGAVLNIIMLIAMGTRPREKTWKPKAHTPKIVLIIRRVLEYLFSESSGP